MTHTTDGHASAPARNSLPEPPGPPNTWWDRESRLRDQANALDALIREDLSRGRALAFLLCAGVVTLVAALVPVMVVDAADSESSEATDAAVAAVLGIAMLAVIALTLLLAVAVLAGLSDPTVLALVPCLIVAGLFGWSTVWKYGSRYNWSQRERGIRFRAHR
ncbi:hypothetical protein ACWD5F_42080 [Streptomyces sp. NPDC002499]